MKKILTILACIGVTVTTAYAGFPTNTTSKTLKIDRLREDFKDFRLKWTGFEDQHVTFVIQDSNGGLDVSSYQAQFKVSKTTSGGTNVAYITRSASQITITTSNIQFSVNHTNIPPNGTYQGELMLQDGASTNIVRTLGRGTIRVNDSLFDDVDGTYERATANLTDYLLKTEAAATYVVQTRTLTAGTDLTGGGTLASNLTFNHEDVSSQVGVTNGAGYAITGVALNGRGHVTYLISTNLDLIFATDSALAATNSALVTQLNATNTILAARITGNDNDISYLYSSNYVQSADTLGGATTDYEWSTGNVWFVAIDSSIETAHDNAAAGDTLLLAAGTYTVTADIDITKAITIIGQGTTIATVTDSINVFHVTASGVKIQHLDIDITADSTIAVNYDGSAGTVLTGLVLHDVDIDMNSHAGLQQGVVGKDASAKMSHVNIDIVSTDNQTRGLRWENAATAEAETRLDCENMHIVQSGASVNSYGFHPRDNSATVDVSVYLVGCSATITESAPHTSVGAYVEGGDAYLYAENCVFSATDTDVQNNGGAIARLRDCTLVNNTTSGTITYNGTTVAGAFFAPLVTGTVVHATSLRGNDIDFGTLADDDVLTWNDTDSKWTNSKPYKTDAALNSRCINWNLQDPTNALAYAEFQPFAVASSMVNWFISSTVTGKVNIIRRNWANGIQDYTVIVTNADFSTTSSSNAISRAFSKGDKVGFYLSVLGDFDVTNRVEITCEFNRAD